MVLRFENIDFCNAILQCLCVLVDPILLREKLGREHIGRSWTEIHSYRQESHFWGRAQSPQRVYHSVRHNKDAKNPATISPIAELLDTLVIMRHCLDMLTPYRLVHYMANCCGTRSEPPRGHNFDGLVPEDAAQWLSRLLDCLAVGRTYNFADQHSQPPHHPEIDALFRLNCKFIMTCSTCRLMFDWDVEGWMLGLVPDANHLNETYTMEDARGPPVQLTAPEGTFSCPQCQLNTQAIGRLHSIVDPPKIMVMELRRFYQTEYGRQRLGYAVVFERAWLLPIARKAAAQYPLIQGVPFIVRDTDIPPNNRPYYKLQAVVKHRYIPEVKLLEAYRRGGHRDLMRLSGKFIAYCQWQATDPQWWRCEDMDVRHGTVEEALQNDPMLDEVPCLLFFIWVDPSRVVGKNEIGRKQPFRRP